MGVTVTQTQAPVAQSALAASVPTVASAVGSAHPVSALAAKSPAAANAALSAVLVSAFAPLVSQLGAAAVNTNTSQVVTVLQALAAPGSVGATQAAGATSRGALASPLGLMGSQPAGLVSKLGPLGAVLSVNSINTNTAVLTASLGAFASLATLQAAQSARGNSTVGLQSVLAGAAVQTAVAVSGIGALSSALTVLGINVGTARVTAILAPLRVSATLAQVSEAGVVSRLPMLWAFFSLPAQAGAQIRATLGPLVSAVAVQPPPAGYAADGGYYVAISARPFYSTLAARPFYGAAWPRSFYILANPDMTPTFDTLDPRETMVLTLDASADLASGETLTSISAITVVQQFGATGALPTLTGQVINAQPVTLTVAGKSVTIAANCGVQVIVTGGATGGRYLIAAVCATSNPDKVLTLKGVLPVSAS